MMSDSNESFAPLIPSDDNNSISLLTSSLADMDVSSKHSLGTAQESTISLKSARESQLSLKSKEDSDKSLKTSKIYDISLKSPKNSEMSIKSAKDIERKQSSASIQSPKISDISLKLPKNSEMSVKSAKDIEREQLSESSDNANASISTVAGGDSELMNALSRRQQIMADQEAGIYTPDRKTFYSIYTEFGQFSRRQIKEYENKFKEYDTNNDGVLEVIEVAKLLEDLKCPQTYVDLRRMIKTEEKINFRKFMSIFKTVAEGNVKFEGLEELAALKNVDVNEVGILGVCNFFVAKSEAVKRGSRFFEDIRREKEDREREEEEKKERRQKFLERKKVFEQ